MMSSRIPRIRKIGQQRGPVAVQRNLLFVAAAVCTTLFTMGAGTTGPESGPEPALQSLRLVPQEARLWGREASQRFAVLGTFSDGLDRDVTSRSRFHVSDPTLASVDATGKVVAVAEGEAVLKAEIEGHKAQARLRTEATEQVRPFRFDRDIASILTRQGCNASDCHGSVKGQSGFKLSLHALYPREDYQWIVEGGKYQVLTQESDGPRVPRVHLQEPEKSLLLRKPTMQVDHKGGLRFGTDSPDYATLLNWIKEGAVYGEESDGARIQRVKVFPSEVALERERTQQLVVTAYRSDGRREDVTHEVRYISQDPHVVTVSQDGLVTAQGNGETTVLVLAAGHAVSARFGVIAGVIRDYPEVHPCNLIDEQVFAKLRKFQILPSAVSSDPEFLRRVCLDIAGTLPPPERVREFLADRDPQKRDKLIELLLNSPQYVDYWSFRFGDLFRVTYTTTGSPKVRKTYEDWLRNCIVQNKPYDQMARERIAAQGFSAAARHYYRHTELIVPHEIMSEQVRMFMGRRLDCAQCHNHPFEIWSQDQFWGLTAFFGNMTQLMSSSLVIDNPEGGRSYDEKREGAKVIHPRRKEEVTARFLDGSPLTAEQAIDPRMALAHWMISQPSFSETVVNRIWGYFFGRGIVDPVDDFKTSNPPTNPKLLKALARDFVDNGYDLKHLMRRIAQSRTYQASGVSNHTNQHDRTNYSRALPRPLAPAVLLDAISHVTGVAEEFPVHRSVGEGGSPPGTRALDLMPELYPCQFLDVYGRSMRNTLPSGMPSLTVAQALHMWAGETYTTKITQETGRLDQTLEAGLADPEIIEEFYLAAFARYPTEQERSELEAFVGQASSRRQRLASLVWAVISSREFAYNH